MTNTYLQDRKTLLEIQTKYDRRGLIFNVALRNVIDCGIQIFNDEKWVADQIDDIRKKHDKAEKEGKTLFTSFNFEKSIIECSVEISKCDPMNIICFIQRETWCYAEGDDCISRDRFIEFFDDLVSVLYDLCYHDDEEFAKCLMDVNINEDEIDTLFGSDILEAYNKLFE